MAPMDRAAELREALGGLSVQEALALARSVELSRLNRNEELPAELVLAALRPTLRAARAPRLPDLRRLVARAFEPFLADREDDPRIPGLVPRSSIVPWWQALETIAGPDLAALQSRLAALVPLGRPSMLEPLAREARAAAAVWTNTLLAELGRPHADAALRPIATRPNLAADITTMAALLVLAEPIGAALDAVDEVLQATGKLVGRRILEFTPEAVTVAKQHYLAFSQTHGMESRYLALALMNRLRDPWQILRLGRALSWKHHDSMLRDTEFGVVGERLIIDLRRSVQDVAALVARRGPLPDLATLGAALATYMEEVEGLLGEFGFRRDSGWGEAIFATRAALAEAMNRDWLGRVAAEAVLGRILPVQRRSGQPRGSAAPPDLRTPTADAAAAAVAATRFLAMLAQRGARHGLGQAREVVDALTAEIDRRADAVLELMRQVPGHAGIEAQIAAAARVLDVLFDDGRGAVLIRRMRLVGQGAA
jgi:hypothetical protein